MDETPHIGTRIAGEIYKEGMVADAERLAKRNTQDRDSPIAHLTMLGYALRGYGVPVELLDHLGLPHTQALHGVVPPPCITNLAPDAMRKLFVVPLVEHEACIARLKRKKRGGHGD